MDKSIKTIIIGIIILVLLGLLIYGSFDISGPGSLIGGLAVLWAGVKSKIFGIKSTEEKIELIKQEHQQKRENWNQAKEEYDTKFRALEAQMKYLDYRSALISDKLNSLNDYEQKKLKEVQNASNDELLQLLNNRYKQ